MSVRNIGLGENRQIAQSHGAFVEVMLKTKIKSEFMCAASGSLAIAVLKK